MRQLEESQEVCAIKYGNALARYGARTDAYSSARPRELGADDEGLDLVTPRCSMRNSAWRGPWSVRAMLEGERTC